MGRKRDTLLRWVNCCCISGSAYERIHELSSGSFFLNVLSLNGNARSADGCPWNAVVKILKEFSITDDIINFNAASQGDEEEILKLVAVCMHVTMVLRPKEDIKERTMSMLSSEDQLVIKTMLHAIVNDEHITRHQLAEIVYDASQELNFSRTCTFYTSSPASSVGRNSPLKRYLDSPMALRLSRLQREVNEKNEEIRRLQSEMMSESDENALLRQRLDDVHRKVKEVEKKNLELVQRLEECRSAEVNSSDQSGDSQLIQIKKQLKRLQSEYEATSQKYCDLNIAHENLTAQREKDRKQMRQLQSDLNDEVARLQRDTAELQLQLDTLQTENMELKHLLEEKKQWIEVLEDQNRTCASERHVSGHHHVPASAPRSPGIPSPTRERESIGFTLLSLEVEKLQDELTANRTELFIEKEKLKSEREAFHLQEQTLRHEVDRVNQQLEQAEQSNQELQQLLEGTRLRVQEITSEWNLVQQQKDQCSAALDAVRSESNEQRHLIQVLESKLEETLRRRDSLERNVEGLEVEKSQLLERITVLQRDNLETLATLESEREDFRHRIAQLGTQLQANQHQVAQQIQSIEELHKQLGVTRDQLEAASSEASRWEAESQRWAKQSSDLESQLLQRTQDFEVRLSSADQKLEAAQGLLTLRDFNISALQSELDSTRQSLEAQVENAAKLERERNQLLQDVERNRQELEQFQAAAESVQLELRSEIDSVSRNLRSKEVELAEQGELIASMEQQHVDLSKRQEELQLAVRGLEEEKLEQHARQTRMEEQLTKLTATVESRRLELISVSQQAEHDLEALRKRLEQEEAKGTRTESQLVELNNQSDALRKHMAELEHEKASLNEKVSALEQEKADLVSSLNLMKVEHQTEITEATGMLEATRQQLLQQQEAAVRIRSQLDGVSREKDHLQSRCTQMESESVELNQKLVQLEEEKNLLESSLSRSMTEFQQRLDESIRERDSLIQEKNQQAEQLMAVHHQLSELVLEHGKFQDRCLQIESEKELLEQQVVTLKKTKETLESNLSEATSQFQSRLSEITEQLETATHQHATSQQELERLQQELERTVDEYQKLELRCRGAESERDSLKERLAEVETQKLEMESAFSSSSDRFQRQLTEAAQKLEAAEQDRFVQENLVASLRQDIERLGQEQLNLQVRSDQIENERNVLKLQTVALAEEKSKIEASSFQTLSDLQNRLALSTQELEQVKEEHLKQTNDAALLRKERDCLLEQQRDLETAKDALLQELTSLEEEKKEMETCHRLAASEFQERLEATLTDLKSITEEKVAQEELLAAARRRQVELEDRVGELVVQSDGLQRTNGQLEEDKAQLHANLSQLDSRLQQLVDEIEVLVAEKVRHQNEAEELRQSLDELKNESKLAVEQVNLQLRSKEEEATLLREKIRSVELELEKEVENNSVLEAQVKSQEDIIQENVQNTEELNNRVELALKHQLELELYNTELETIRKNLESSLAEAHATHATACAQFQKDADALRSQVQSIEFQLGEKTEKLAQTAKKMEEISASSRSQVEELQKEVTYQLELKEHLTEELVVVHSQLEQILQKQSVDQETIKDLNERIENIRREKDDWHQRHQQLVAEKEALVLQVKSLESRVCDLEASIRAERETSEALRVELDARQRDVVEQSITISTTTEAIRKLELVTDTLQSEINEMNLRKQEALEAAQLEHLSEVEALTSKLRAKEVELSNQTEQLRNLKAQRDRLLQEQQVLEQKIAVLETDVEVLRVTSDEDRQASLVELDRLKQELNAKSTEQFDSITSLQSDMDTMCNTLEIVQRKLQDVTAEKEKLSAAHNRLEHDNAQLKESLTCAQQKWESKEREIVDLMEQLKSVTTQVATTSKLNGELEEKQRQLEAEKESALQEKRELVEAQALLKSTRQQLETQLAEARQELKLVQAEIRLNSEETIRLKSQLVEVTRLKDGLEAELVQRRTLQASEKDNLSQKNAWLEEELGRAKSAHQTVKAELEAERNALVQLRTELSLEHRKEKAALEARLQLAQTQVKSLQEKLVSVTFTTSSSQMQSQLEQKVAVLASEVETANKVKADLEKKLKLAEERFQRESSVKDQKVIQEKRLQTSKSVGSTNDAELTMLRTKCDSLKRSLAEKESIIEQCNTDLDRLKSHVSDQQEEIAALAAEKKKLIFETRTLKNEQQYLLAQISAEKDKAAAKTSRLSLALQRGSSGSDGGSLADNMMEARRRSLRPSRSEVTARQLENEVFKAPRSVLGDSCDVFKMPSTSSRRDSTSSIASNRSDISSTSRMTGILPLGAGRFFVAEDEDGELFSSSYLDDMKEGKCRVADPSLRRMSELHRRNTLQPPHMRSAYPAELNDERLRQVDLPLATEAAAASNNDVNQLAKATSLLGLSTPPAMNTRKRRSWNLIETNDTPVTAVPAKRRSVEKDRLSLDSMQSETRSITSQGSAERNRTKRRESSSQTTYQRPGPPTPARGSSMKENIASTPSMPSPPKDTPRSQKGSSKLSSKTGSPQSNRSARLTPGSVIRKVQSKLRSNKQSAAGESTPGGSTPRSANRSKLNIFRKPLGSRGCNSEAAKF